MVVVRYNLVGAVAAFSLQYDRFMRAISREASRMAYAPAEARIIDNLRGGPLTQAQLRGLTQIERGQLSRAIKNLVAKKFIEPISHSPGRWKSYGLTALGWRQHFDTGEVRLRAVETAMSKMLRPERKALVDALEELGKQKYREDDFEEVDRYRTAYPGELSKIIKNALEFYSRRALNFNSQIEGYVLRQFAAACERTHHHIIVLERLGYIAGSVLLLVDRKNASARFEGLWFAPNWYLEEDVVGVLKLAERRAATAGCRNLTARIPRHKAWPNMFEALDWTLMDVQREKIAGIELDIETWSRTLTR